MSGQVTKTIIDQGVANLKEFGYPDVNAENIFTDQIYSAFFRSMLDDSMGASSVTDVSIALIIKRLDGDT